MRKKSRFAAHDYQYSSLPNTRKDAFKDVYRHNFLNILKSGIMLLVFAVPLMLFMLIMDIGKLGMVPANYSEEDLKVVLLIWDIIVNVGFLILFILVLVALSGILRVLKLTIYQEGVDFFYDFKQGIKENFAHILVFCAFYSLIYLVTYFLQLFFLGYQLIGLAILLFFFIIFTPLFSWCIMTISVYQTKVVDYLKNGAFFFFKNIGFSMLFLLLTIWPIIICILFSENIFSAGVNIFYIIIKNVALIVMFLLYYPCLTIIYLLFASSKFDLFINKDNYPEIYRKGLYDIAKNNKQ